MTAHLSFDTLAFAKRLAAAGMDSRQAQALAEALNDIVFDTLATKSDLRELEVATKASLRELEHRLTNNLTVRTGAMIAGSAALVVAVLGTLISLS
ncbi:MAG TPA: hypothetical protein VGA98_09050 [Allosphingosinicella sp.]|jgi:hypothetical protein